MEDTQRWRRSTTVELPTNTMGATTASSSEVTGRLKHVTGWEKETILKVLHLAKCWEQFALIELGPCGDTSNTELGVCMSQKFETYFFKCLFSYKKYMYAVW